MAIKNNDVARGTIADVAVITRVVEDDGTGFAEVGNLRDHGAGLYVDDLYDLRVRDVEQLGGRIEGEGIPISRAADVPGFLDEKGRARKVGSRGNGSDLR